MPRKIFISYRRDDAAFDAGRVRDALAAKFGESSIFMDIDNLHAGQRFDEELAKALAACHMLLAIIGSRWMDLLKDKRASGERDYVHEEIAQALRRRIVVIPVLVGREGQMPPLPRAEELWHDIRDLVLHQKQDVAHEHFGRDMAELIDAIRKSGVRAVALPRVRPAVLGWFAVGAVGALVAAYQQSATAPGPSSSGPMPTASDGGRAGSNGPNAPPGPYVVPQEMNKAWGEVIKLDEPAGKITIETRFPRPFDDSERTFEYRASDPSMLKMVKPGHSIYFESGTFYGQLTVTKIVPSIF
jgi:Cu/Ag efflux protein CusF